MTNQKQLKPNTPQPRYITVVGVPTILVKQPCCIQTKLYGLYRKMTMNIHFGDPSLNRVISNIVL